MPFSRSRAVIPARERGNLLCAPATLARFTHLCCHSRRESAFSSHIAAKHGNTLLLPLLAFLFAATAAQAQATAATLAHVVDNHYNHLHSLQAHFVERYQGPGVDRSESGTLLLLKPGRMRWSYDSPAGKLFVVNGSAAISYTPGDITATRIPAKQLADFRSPLALLLGQTHLERELTNLSATLATTGTTTLTGTPKGPVARQVRQVEVTFQIASQQITTLRLLNTDGTQLTFTLSDQKEDLPVAAANFTFTPPPGVTTVDASSTE